MPVVDDLSIRFTDEKGENARMHIYVPTGQTFVALQAFLDAFLADLDVVTDAQITAATLTRAFVIPGGLKAAPIADSDVQEGVNLLWDVAASNYNFSNRLPAITPTYVVGRTLELANVDIIAMSNHVINGVATVLPSDRAGGDITGLIAGAKTFHK